MTNHVIFDDTHIFSFTFWDDEFMADMSGQLESLF